MNESAYTLNARPDPDLTITLPNHAAMVTSRLVLGANGHHWTDNVDPAPDVTIHTQNGQYVPGVFDVVHDNGGKTGFYASKTKFSLFDFSYDAQNGAPDLTGIDNGRDKIDTYYYHWSTDQLVAEFKKKRGAQTLDFAFLHFGNPDAAGHATGWSDNTSSTYADAVRKVDGHLLDLLNFIETEPGYANKTTVIVTTDHGGTGQNHAANTAPAVYTIPFWVWNGTRTTAADLYTINPLSRVDPGSAFVSAEEAALRPPVRNADAANLGLGLMGLPPIPYSSINAAQDLTILPSSLGPPTPHTATFQQGVLPHVAYVGAKDTYITSDQKSTAHGLKTTMAVDGAPYYAALMQWDLSSIPRDAQVTSATLTLDIINPTNDVYELYAMSRSWDETSATWNQASTGVAWNELGANGSADHETAILGTLKSSNPGILEISLNSQGVLKLNEWIADPSSNFGFIIQDYVKAWDGASFWSKEADESTLRPKLTVNYLWADPLNQPDNIAPTAIAQIDVVGQGTFDITASAFNSFDPDGLVATMKWDLGDGTVLYDETIAYTYESSGSYTVQLTVWDNDGASSSVTQTITIESNITVPIEVVFQDLVSPTSDYTGTRDTKIMAPSASEAHGAETSLEMDGAPKTNGLIRWDLSSIPTNATITSVEMTYNVTNVSTDPYGLYVVETPWEEASATWNSASSTKLWDTPGATNSQDSGTTVLGLLTGNTLGPQHITLTAAGLSQVQNWVSSPALNRGFIIRPVGPGISYDGLDISSREATTAADRPALHVTYTVSSFEPVNASPTARFTITPESGFESVEVHADAGASTDSDGQIVSYSWDFGDGFRTSGQQANHKYNSAGQYTVQLTVADNRGGVDISHHVVQVLDASVHVESFQDGAFPSSTYSGTKDTFILETAPLQNFGSTDQLEMDGSPKSSALIKWDISNIPAGATIVAADITVEITNWSWDAYEIYGMLRPWSETAATWSNSGFSTGWEGAAGALDRHHEVLGRANTYQTGSLTIPLNEQGISWVQRWVNSPSENYGIVFQDYSNAWDGIDFLSRESNTISKRPKLTVEYKQGEAPVTLSRVSSDKGSEVTMMPLSLSGPLTFQSAYSEALSAIKPGITAVHSSSQMGPINQEYRIDLGSNTTALLALPSADSLLIDRNRFALDQTLTIDGASVSVFARALTRGKNAVNVPQGAELFLVVENQSTSSVSVQHGIEIPEKHELSVSAFPNPFTQSLTVDVKGIGLVRLELYDMLGRMVLHTEVGPGQTRMDTSHLPSGVYALRGAHTKNGNSRTILITKSH